METVIHIFKILQNNIIYKRVSHFYKYIFNIRLNIDQNDIKDIYI